MKAFVLVMSLFVAGSAFAGTDFEAMSWTSILRSGKYEPDYTNKVHFQNGSVWMQSWSKKLCTDGTFIYGGTFLKKWKDDNGNVYRTEKIDLVQPIVSERQRCKKYSGDNCSAYQTVVYKQSPHRLIKIMDQTTGNDDGDMVVLGVKSYSIPKCGTLTPVPAN